MTIFEFMGDFQTKKLSSKIIPMIIYMDSLISKHYIKFFVYFSIHYSDYIIFVKFKQIMWVSKVCVNYVFCKL
jgi:hypothetical protein